MKFVIISHDGGSVLCQFADAVPVIWIDARVAEAIGYSYALQFETRTGAGRCAFMHNGAVMALGDWDYDAEANREVSPGRAQCMCTAHDGRAPRGVVRNGFRVARSGPAQPVPRQLGAGGTRGAAGGRALHAVARLPPLAQADWRERGRDSRLTGDAEYIQLAGRFQR